MRDDVKDLPVLKAKRFGVYTCHERGALKEAAQLMDDRNISSLVVVGDEGQLRGIITRSDLVRACYMQVEWASQPVKACMNADVVTVELDATLYDVMQLLIEKHIHRVVAVRRENDKVIPMGILSDADIVYHMAQWTESQMDPGGGRYYTSSRALWFSIIDTVKRVA